MSYPKRVFLIDDDEDDCLFFQMGLREISRHIEFAYNQDSTAALELLGDPGVPRPDIIFLDWNMPKLNGRECLATIRQNPRYNEIPVIILTTSSSRQDREAARLEGASFFLSKPNSIKDLLRSLETIFTYNWKNKRNVAF